MKLELVLLAGSLVAAAPVQWLDDFFSSLGYAKNSAGAYYKTAVGDVAKGGDSAAATADQNKGVNAGFTVTVGGDSQPTTKAAPAVTVTVTYGDAANAPVSTVAQTTTTSTEPTTASQSSSTNQAPSSAISSSQPTSGSSSQNFESYDDGQAFWDALNSVWGTFYNGQAFEDNDPKCGSGVESPAVWPLAIIGRAAVEGGDQGKIYQIINNLNDYKNSEGWFSASTAKDNDVYVDDNAQIAWVFCDAYKVTNDPSHLDTCKSLVGLIQTQQRDDGGVYWDKDGSYIASISTIEAGLAAVRLFEHTNDQSLLQFAQKTLDYLYNTLQDKSDGLFYDGYDLKDNSINKGKLTYTVGCAISTLTYLFKYTNNASFLDKAQTLAKAAVNKSGAFYNEYGVWNNQLQYVHLLYQGFYDAWTLGSGQFDSYKDEVKRQSEYVHQFLRQSDGSYVDNAVQYGKATFDTFKQSFAQAAYEPDSKNFCNDNNNADVKRSLINGGSAAQIYHAVSVLF